MVNIAWNKHEWKKVDIESPTSFSYTKNKPGHESLNFKPTKIDQDSPYIFGYTPGFIQKRNLIQPGVVFFFSKDIKTDKRFIVGVYGNVEQINEEHNVPDFKGTLCTNMRAEEKYSMEFPEYLNADRYREPEWNRIMTQANIRYIKQDTARKIIADEFSHCRDNIGRDTLRRIWTLLSEDIEFDDIKSYRYQMERQNEAEKVWTLYSNGQITKLYKKLNTQSKENTTNSQTVIRKRDTANIEALKAIYKYKCQICGYQLKTQNNRYYIEAAHITPKSEGGNELPWNILILCPNHHKEFDYKKPPIKERTESKIVIVLDDKDTTLNLVSKSCIERHVQNH